MSTTPNICPEEMLFFNCSFGGYQITSHLWTVSLVNYMVAFINYSQEIHLPECNFCRRYICFNVTFARDTFA